MNNNFKLYCFSNNSNGTADLLVCDGNDQLIATIQEAVWNGENVAENPEDSLGNIQCLFYAESVGLITYDLIADEEEGPTESRPYTRNCIYSGLVDLNPVGAIALEEVIKHRACSPVDPDGKKMLEHLADLGVIDADDIDDITKESAA